VTNPGDLESNDHRASCNTAKDPRRARCDATCAPCEIHRVWAEISPTNRGAPGRRRCTVAAACSMVPIKRGVPQFGPASRNKRNVCVRLGSCTPSVSTPKCGKPTEPCTSGVSVVRPHRGRTNARVKGHCPLRGQGRVALVGLGETHGGGVCPGGMPQNPPLHTRPMQHCWFVVHVEPGGKHMPVPQMLF
jgi:hypothetical protein